jgi:hypothetical protein
MCLVRSVTYVSGRSFFSIHQAPSYVRLAVNLVTSTRFCRHVVQAVER